MINATSVVFIFQIANFQHSSNRLSWVCITILSNHSNPSKWLIPEKNMKYNGKRP